MKRNDSGDFCVLYVEPGDEKAALFQVIAGQKKPVVIMLAEQSRVFQRPDDFTTLKHVKRQIDLPIVFVIPSSGHLMQLAARNGFPVYPSMDALADALSTGQLTRQRTPGRTTNPLVGDVQIPMLQPIATDVGQMTPKDGFQRIAIDTKQMTPSNGIERVPVSPVRRPSAPRKTVPLPLTEAEVLHKKTGPLLPPSPPLVTAPAPPPARTRRFPLLLVVLSVAIVVAGLGFFLVQSHALNGNGAATAVVGHVAFTSSEQLNENTSQGIEDQIAVDLTNIPAPAAQDKYYGWLLADKSQNDATALSLGALQANNGHIHLFYGGDAQHTNLLLTFSRFLVTEEDAAMTPVAPSPDPSKWRYYAEFSTTPIPGPNNPEHFSYLDHLRHLLAADPTLDELELPGGLNNWFFRNTGKLLEWVSSTREEWEDTRDAGFVQRQTARVLEYLDGTSFTYLDLPANSPLLVNERLARVGLLAVNGANQQPPAYTQHITKHLSGLLQAGGDTAELRQNIADIISALNNVQYWLAQLRQNAQQIMKMSNAQLQQDGTLTLLNDMIANANDAYTGQLDPSTNTMREGVVWIHDHMQSLATLNVTAFNNGGNASHLVLPGTNQPMALMPYGTKNDGGQ